MTDNPWNALPVPPNANAVGARRVDANLPWDFFWGRGADRRCLLLLHHDVDSSPQGQLPRVKGIEIVDTPTENDRKRTLVLRLLDSSQQDIFLRLCRDIVDSTSSAVSERDAVARALARTWRWHHLLRGGNDNRLSAEEQKGLIGELLVIERYLLPELSPVDALAAWMGPMGTPKDFEIGNVSIEVKARRGAATPFIAISSEYQLDTADAETLFLCVVDLSRAPADATDFFTLTSVAHRVRDAITTDDSLAVNAFELLLAAVGFRWEDDYSDSRWCEGGTRLFRVSDEFPRITASQTGSAVSHVRYSISMTECEPFTVDDEQLHRTLRGDNNGD